MDKVLHIGNRREMFWDDYLLDTQKTTAYHRLMHPVYQDTVHWIEAEGARSSVSFPCLLKDDKGYRMYYISWNSDFQWVTNGVNWRVITSPDGKNWTKPSLGIHEINGSKDNNIIFTKKQIRDNAFAFYDPNPNCPPEEKYKCLADGLSAGQEGDPEMKRGLWYYYSADGYHWNRYGLISTCGQFDTLNTAHWNGKQYVAYIRNYHDINMEGVTGQCTAEGVEDVNDHYAPPGHKNSGKRDIRVMYSDDFRNWTRPERIQFNDEHDISMYTNVVSVYERAPHILVGFPTRYYERPQWTENFERLGNEDNRKMRRAAMETNPRVGLAITDCLFMWSRDGKNWNRSMEAFMSPGYEDSDNWVYGDCYPAYGFVDNGDETLSIYTVEYHHSYDKEKPVKRYTIRKDGFACYMAGGKEETLLTKPLIFEGKKLHLNFETSAFGHIYVEVLNEAGTEVLGRSFEVFGNNIDREVSLEDGRDFSEFAGKTIRLRFTMLDAKVYSMKFE